MERGKHKPKYAGFQRSGEKSESTPPVQIKIRNSVKRPMGLGHVQSDENLAGYSVELVQSQGNSPARGAHRKEMQGYRASAINGVFGIMQDRKAMEFIELQKHCLIAIPSRRFFFIIILMSLVR
jgi:hypothetical protein